MNDLQQIFSDLKEEWARRRQQAKQSYDRHLKAVAEMAPMLRAVIAHRRGDTLAIPKLLRSGYRLTLDDQKTLAHFLEGGFDQPSKAGRRKSNERWVGMTADLFLREWQEAAKSIGVSTYGKVPTMRDHAIDFVIAEFLPAAIAVNRDAVLDYMTKRGKQRRN